MNYGWLLVKTDAYEFQLTIWQNMWINKTKPFRIDIWIRMSCNLLQELSSFYATYYNNSKNDIIRDSFISLFMSVGFFDNAGSR